jgi:hypothetical protein
MPQDTPKTLPANFFEKKATGTPNTLPANFFDSTPDPTKPDPTTAPPNPILNATASAFVGGHPYGGGGQTVTGTPEEIAGIKKSQQNVTEAGVASAATAGLGGVPGMLGWLMRGMAAGGGAGLAHMGTEAATKGKPDIKGSVETGLVYGGTEMTGEAAVKGAGKVISKAFPKVDPLAKINKLLGVDPKEVIPGKTPASLDEFAANPARGAQKYGLTEEKLKGMNALERNSAIMQARDKAGKSLDATLEAATQAGKKVNIQDTLNETFSEIADPKLLEQAEKRMLQILDKAGVSGKALRDLTPMEARTVQRGLDNFAKFANESEAKSFGDIADQLRTGISKETRKVVPESAEFDRDYTDLVRASNATQKSAKEFATTVPENKLRKYLIRALITGGLGAAGAMGYEVARHSSTPVP